MHTDHMHSDGSVKFRLEPVVSKLFRRYPRKHFYPKVIQFVTLLINSLVETNVYVIYIFLQIIPPRSRTILENASSLDPERKHQTFSIINIKFKYA